jgi:broad specificity phosphatase PhoE
MNTMEILKPSQELLSWKDMSLFCENNFFIRHGQTEFNIKKLLQGSTNIPLSLEGEGQAHQIALKLSQLNLPIHSIFSSPLERTKKTALIIATHLNKSVEQIIYMDALKEFNFGVFEGQQISVLKKNEVHNEWIENPILMSNYSQTPLEGENFLNFLQRVNNAILYVFHENKSQNETNLIISHAMVTRAIRFLALLSNRGIQKITFENIRYMERNFFYYLTNEEHNSKTFINIPHDILNINTKTITLSNL